MNRALAVVLALAVAGLVAFYLSATPTPAPPPVSTPAIDDAPTAPAETPAAPTPVAPPTPIPPDHGATPTAVIDAERTGLFGRDAEWIERMVPRGWTVVGDGWRSPAGTEVTFATREGRVVGARARFPETVFSSALSELTVPLVGHGGGGGAMLPGGEQAESLEPDPRPREGTVRVSSGEYDWTLWLRTTGESPYGPARFDLGDVGPLDGSAGPGP